jgi:WD repeat/SOCS box-containing protein 1
VIPWDWKRRLNALQDDERVIDGDDGSIVTIDAGGPVHSMVFCSITTNTKHHVPTTQQYRHITSHDVILATGLRNGRIRLWDAVTGVLKLELCDHTGTVTDLSFAPHGSMLLVSSSVDGTLKLWDLDDDGNMIKTLRANCTTFYGCQWSPDGLSLASVGNYHSAQLWDMKSRTVRCHLDGHRNTVTKCAYSPDGALLATASYDSRVIMWDVQSGVALFNLEHVSPPLSPIYAGGANGYHVRSVSFSRSGRNIATVCDDGYVRFWDIFGADSVVQVAPVDGALVCGYSPDGSLLTVGTSAGDLSLWLSPQPVPTLQHLCRMTIRRLLTRDAVDRLLCMPQPIRRFLQYDRQPISASG